MKNHNKKNKHVHELNDTMRDLGTITRWHFLQRFVRNDEDELPTAFVRSTVQSDFREVEDLRRRKFRERYLQKDGRVAEWHHSVVKKNAGHNFHYEECRNLKN